MRILFASSNRLGDVVLSTPSKHARLQYAAEIGSVADRGLHAGLRRAVGSLPQMWLRRHRFSACLPGSPASTALTGADSRSIARRAGVACVSARTLDQAPGSLSG
jgi:hypothetical protein